MLPALGKVELVGLEGVKEEVGESGEDDDDEEETDEGDSVLNNKTPERGSLFCSQGMG